MSIAGPGKRQRTAGGIALGIVVQMHPEGVDLHRKILIRVRSGIAAIDIQFAAERVGGGHRGFLLQFFFDADQLVEHIGRRLAVLRPGRRRPAKQVDPGKIDAVTGRVQRTGLRNHRYFLVVAVINHGIHRQVALAGGIGELDPLERLGLIHRSAKNISVADFGVGDRHGFVDQAVQLGGRRFVAGIGIGCGGPHHERFGLGHEIAQVADRLVRDLHPGCGVLDIGGVLFVLHDRRTVLQAPDDPHGIVRRPVDELAVRCLLHQFVLGVQRFIHA